MKGRNFWFFGAEKYFSGQFHRIWSHFVVPIIVFQRAACIWKLDRPHKNTKSPKIGVLPIPSLVSRVGCSTNALIQNFNMSPKLVNVHCKWADGTRRSLMVDFLDVFNHATLIVLQLGASRKDVPPKFRFLTPSPLSWFAPLARPAPYWKWYIKPVACIVFFKCITISIWMTWDNFRNKKMC